MVDKKTTAKPNSEAMANNVRAAILFDLAVLATKTPEWSVFATKALKRVRDVISITWCTVARLNADGTSYQLHLLLKPQRARHLEKFPLTLPITEGLAGATIRKNRMHLADDPTDLELFGFQKSGRKGQPNHVLCLPLEAFGTVVGAISFGSTATYGADQVAYAQNIAAQLVFVIAHGRLAHELEQVKEERTRAASFPNRNPSAIVEIDLDGQIYFMNPAAQRLLPDLETDRCASASCRHARCGRKE
jgi:GAF domain-containing protein